MDLKISSNNRTNYLPQFLHNNGYDVEVVTSNFNHHRKLHQKQIEQRDYKFTVLDEPGYSKNVSIKRLISIRKYKRNLKIYLSNHEPVDYVYCFVPPHSIANEGHKFAKRIHAEFIIDVRDLWPEAFRMIFKNPLIYDIITFPLTLSANSIYRKADKIIAVSETYLNRAKMCNNTAPSEVVYLGTSFSEVDNIIRNEPKAIKAEQEFWIAYAGTIGNSYDLETLIKAYRLIIDEGLSNIKLHILGSGPLEDKVKSLDLQLNTNVVFHGRVSYSNMISFIKNADVVINVLVDNAPQSIINKHMDYAAVGIPVVSTQTTKEYVDLIELFKAGINVNNTPLDLKDAIVCLYNDTELRHKMGINHRRMGELLFNRDKIYSKIISMLN